MMNEHVKNKMTIFLMAMNNHAEEYATPLRGVELARAITAKSPLTYLEQQAENKFDWIELIKDCQNLFGGTEEEVSTIVHATVVIPVAKIVENYLDTRIGYNLTLRQTIWDIREIRL